MQFPNTKSLAVETPAARNRKHLQNKHKLSLEHVRLLEGAGGLVDKQIYADAGLI